MQAEVRATSKSSVILAIAACPMIVASCALLGISETRLVAMSVFLVTVVVLAGLLYSMHRDGRFTNIWFTLKGQWRSFGGEGTEKGSSNGGDHLPPQNGP